MFIIQSESRGLPAWLFSLAGCGVGFSFVVDGSHQAYGSSELERKVIKVYFVYGIAADIAPAVSELATTSGFPNEEDNNQVIGELERSTATKRSYRTQPSQFIKMLLHSMRAIQDFISVQAEEAGGLDSLTLNSLYDKGSYRASQQPVYGSPALNQFEAAGPFGMSAPAGAFFDFLAKRIKNLNPDHNNIIFSPGYSDGMVKNVEGHVAECRPLKSIMKNSCINGSVDAKTGDCKAGNDTCMNMPSSHELGTNLGYDTGINGLPHVGNVFIQAKCIGIADTPKKSNSFTNIFKAKNGSKRINFRSLVSEEKMESFDVVLLKSASDAVKNRYDNTLIGYFIEGLEQVLQRGSWMIRMAPIILIKWYSKSSLKKGKVTRVPVWIKLHGVPILAYSEDGLSLIATQIGKPVLLDAFTSSMCVDSRERIDFSRALIKVSLDSKLKKELIMAIQFEEGNGYTKEVIRVEYERKLPHYVECKSFSHGTSTYLRRVIVHVPKTPSMASNKLSTMEDQDEGFVEVKSRKNKAKKQSDGSKGAFKGTSNLDASKIGDNEVVASESTKEKGNSYHKDDVNVIDPNNSFDKLMEEDKVRDECTKDDDVVTEEVKVQEEDSLWSLFKAAKEASTSKAKSPTLDVEDESDEDEVSMPDVMPSGGFLDDLDCFDGYEAQVYDLPEKMQAFCDQYDIRIKSRDRKQFLFS
ncbi:hypothetical protein Tco_0145660 [Tanacetum coccineum]